MQRLGGLVLICWFLCTTVLYAAATNSSITDIKISSDKNQERIQLVFASDFQESVSTDFENGLLQVTFPRTTFDPSLAFMNINDRFIQNIRLVKVAGSSVLEVHFADPGFDAIGMIKEKTDGTLFKVLINKTEKFKIEEPAASKPLKTNEENQPDQQEISLGGSPFWDSDMTVNIVKMLVALSLMLLFFYVLLWAYNRFFVTRFRFNKGKYDIKVSSSYHINPKQKIVVLEINGSAYACGVTANNISVISKVSADTFSDYLTNLDLNKNSDISFADIRSQYLEEKKRQATLQEEPAEPESRFAAELIKRVKNLKPLD